MGSTTMGVKLDEATRDRIKGAAQRIDRTPHWLIKQAIFNYLERLENGKYQCLTHPEVQQQALWQWRMRRWQGRIRAVR